MILEDNSYVRLSINCIILFDQTMYVIELDALYKPTFYLIAKMIKTGL